MKLLNIQLKIQLNYSHNFAQMRVGKTTIIEMNRANGHKGMKETSQHRTPLGCGTGRLCLWLKENRAGLAASHEKEQPEPVLPTADERGGDAHRSILLWCHQPDTSPAEWGISSQAHQKELQLPE